MLRDLSVRVYPQRGRLTLTVAATLGFAVCDLTAQEARKDAEALILKPHPFGLLLSGRDVKEKTLRARAVGARYYRTVQAVFTGAWKGRSEECEAAREAGLELVLTVRNGDGGGKPSGPPADIEAYRRRVGEILDACKPSLLVVENEENSKALFYTGTPEEYHRQLAAAAEVAHAREIKCANGGLVSDLVAILVAEAMIARGEVEKGEALLTRSLNERGNVKRLRTTEKYREQRERGTALLAGYKAAGIDYVNFHWYNADPADLGEAVKCLRETTGLPVISNELGQQKNEDPAQVRAIMGKIVELELPVAIWFSIDVPDHAQARALFNEDGSLRPNGEAYRDFLKEKYGE
ncbi:MAG: hypothetical protein HYY93_08600 [Planctomycetes bacterium]|nr:hypothetical protein [Planctomycetota bacterium]